ncbi:MAG: serine--tRNA ligase [Chlamydiia bacterium]|nr:serine--tRNA ligase [Chlamydiia bacterium]
MLDIKLIRKEREHIEKKIQKKEPGLTLGPLLELDQTIRNLKTEVEEYKAKRNALSKTIGNKKPQKESVDEMMAEVRKIGEKITALDHKLVITEREFNDVLSRLPNVPADDVKVSQDKNDNVLIKTSGEKPHFSFTPKNHLELNERLKLFDFHATAKTSGTGWPAYRGMGARLEWALLSYMIDIQIMNGFEFWLPPLLVRPQVMFGSGQIPKFNGQFYQLKEESLDHELYLVPTAEVVLNGLHFEEILEANKLPLCYSAYTPCFRREAGAAGTHERGLIRVHQFNKVEMFVFCTPENDQKMQDKMLVTAEEILNGLGLHYRHMMLVTGDMSFTAAKTIDIEVWLPGQNAYYEVSSISNCTDYQARRSKIRYRDHEGKLNLVHTLNGSGLATPRLLVSLLENYQREDGSVDLPPVLAEKLGTHRLTPMT